MSDTADYQAAFRQRRRDAGFRKLSLYLTPEEAALLDGLKTVHRTDHAVVVTALKALALET